MTIRLPLTLPRMAPRWAFEIRIFSTIFALSGLAIAILLTSKATFRDQYHGHHIRDLHLARASWDKICDKIELRNSSSFSWRSWATRCWSCYQIKAKNSKILQTSHNGKQTYHVHGSGLARFVSILALKLRKTFSSNCFQFWIGHDVDWYLRLTVSKSK